MALPLTIRPNPWVGLRMRYLMAIDLVCIGLAIVISFVIRYEALINVGPYLRLSWTFFLLAPLVRLPVYTFFRLYYRLWRYASVQELRMIVMAGMTSSALIYVLNFGLMPFLVSRPLGSRSIWLLEGVLSLCFLGASRFILRLLQERYRPQDLAQVRGFVRNPGKVLIMGAGDAGAMILREIQSNGGLGLKVVGLLDDDPAKLGFSVHGVPVLGNREAIPALAAKHQIDQVIIAIPTAPGRDLREIVHICERADVQPLTIPGIYSLLDGTVRLNQVRNVEIEDLLRRETIVTDTAAVAQLLRGRRVLVTGGGGSIGSELCRQILRCQPAELVLLGHGENSIFEIDNELTRFIERMGGTRKIRMRALIADIRFPERIHSVFAQVQPEIVFHAAAHKHVPLMEANPEEAITNNVLGTRNVLNAALAHNVEHFVMISTDKAVNPTSVMGASKRVAELLVHEAAISSGKPYVAVRFGNVLGSRGSVVLTFKQQIADGGPVTVTDPEMRRYFMTIPEAVQLVLQASVLGKGGEVFLLDMGEPVKIVDMAEDLIRLSGLEVGRDIEIVYTGLRPGEKLYEELFVAGENYARTQHEKVFIAANASSFVPEHLTESINALELAAERGDREAIIRGLRSLVPEYGTEPEPKSSDLTGAAPEPARPVTISQPSLRTATSS